MYTRLYMYQNVHSSIVHSCPKLDTTKYPPTVKWIHELWYIQAMEYYMTMKMNELKPHAMAQINLTCDSEGKKRKKKNQDTKEYTLRDSIHLKSKKNPNGYLFEGCTGKFRVLANIQRTDKSKRTHTLSKKIKKLEATTLLWAGE